MTNCNLNATLTTQTTYQHPWYIALQRLANTTTYESQSKLKPSKEKTGRRSTDDSRTGDISESIVETEAWKRGAEVFPNKGCTGATDIVLKINGILVEIDVKTEVFKTMKGREGWWGVGSVKPTEGVHIVLVNPSTETIRWRQFRNKKLDCPPGLEDFWN